MDPILLHQIGLSLFIPTLHCLKCCNFIILESDSVKSSNFVIFQSCFGYSSLLFHINLRISLSISTIKPPGILLQFHWIRRSIRGESHLTNIESSEPWTQLHLFQSSLISLRSILWFLLYRFTYLISELFLDCF